MARNIGNNYENPEQPEKGTEEGVESAGQSGQIKQPEEPVSEEPAAPKKKMSKGARVALIVVIVAVVAVAGVFAYLFLSENQALTQEQEAQIIDNGTFYDGISIAGVDLSGKTIDQARPEVEKKAQEQLGALSISYTVDDDTFTLRAEELGAAVDLDAALEQAMLYGRSGNFFERQNAIDTAKEQGVEIELPVTYSQQAISDAVSKNDAELSSPAKDATVELKTTSDEEKKITGYEISFTDEEVGYGADEDKLVADLYAAVTSGSFEPVSAELKEIQPDVTRAELEKQYTERGIYETEYSSSDEGRRYNIWKMANIINGVKIEPGETWSINEEAGPRTYSKGWKGAPGISDGEYKEEAGGGICQVSSTLYTAVLRAEVTVADRTHHSWPLSYVPGGLDATISTGSPDFKITNNYDVPIYIVTRCDGEGARTIEVAIIGPPYEDGLTRDFYSELVKTVGSGGVVEIPDASLPAGARQTIIGAHDGKTYNVYKQLLDASGSVVGEPELYYVDTYSPKPAKVRVGTGGGAPSADGNMPPWVQPENW